MKALARNVVLLVVAASAADARTLRSRAGGPTGLEPCQMEGNDAMSLSEDLLITATPFVTLPWKLFILTEGKGEPDVHVEIGRGGPGTRYYITRLKPQTVKLVAKAIRTAMTMEPTQSWMPAFSTFDGTEITFKSVRAFPVSCVKTHAPPSETVAGRMVDLAGALRDHALTSATARVENEQRIVERAEVLLHL